MTFKHLVEQHLVLVNVWDIPTLRLAESMGCAAVATSSGAIAWSLGLVDGGIDGEPLLRRAKEILTKATIPVSVDVERGYSSNIHEIVACVNSVVTAGAAGINIEDSANGQLFDVTEQATTLKTVTLELAGIEEVMVNARCDLALAGTALEAASEYDYRQRIEAYLNAGADQVFLPGVAPCELLGKIAGDYPKVLNTMASQEHKPSTYFDLGITRVSLGTGPCEAAYGATMAYVADMTESQSSQVATPTYAVLNELVSR